jgi:hypothetical protein
MPKSKKKLPKTPKVAPWFVPLLKKAKEGDEIEVMRKKALVAKLRALPKERLMEVIVEIHSCLWDVYDEDYPDGEVSGADFIESVNSIFCNNDLGPEEET